MAVNLDIQAITNGAERALNRFANERNDIHRRAFETTAYTWPNETRRQNRTVAGTTRDKVDLGNLRDSGGYAVNGLQCIFSWEEDYAAAAFFGYTTRAGNTFPGSNWLKVADDIKPVEDSLGEAFRNVFN